MQGLVDTKTEYIKYIQDAITIPIAEKFNSYYNACIHNKSGLKGFQKELSKIVEWNNFIIEKEYTELISNSKYTNLDKLYKITIMTSIKIKIYEYKDTIDNIKIVYPSFQDFIHKCYINIAQFIWKNAFLFYKNNLRDVEIQNNYNIIEKNIKKNIKKTIRECTPINNIIEQLEENIKSDNNIIEQYIDVNITDNNNNKFNLEDRKLIFLLIMIIDWVFIDFCYY